MPMKHKAIDGLKVEVKDADQGRLSAVICTFNAIDHDGDVVVPGAFTDGERVRLSAYNHASWGPGALPIGKGAIRTTDTEAIFDGEFFLNTQTGRDTFEIVKQMGDLQEYSWGFDILESDRGQRDGEDVQYLRKVKVHEVSPVLLGASVGTRTLAVKGLDAAKPEELVKALLDLGAERAAELLADGELKLIDHLTFAKATVAAVTKRLEAVKADRAEKGKDLAEESRESAKDLADELEPITKALREVSTSAAEPKGVDLDADVTFALAASRGRL